MLRFTMRLASVSLLVLAAVGAGRAHAQGGIKPVQAQVPCIGCPTVSSLCAPICLTPLTVTPPRPVMTQLGVPLFTPSFTPLQMPYPRMDFTQLCPPYPTF